jgi:ABC-type nitrate/sulfonate/bicarbonate transport system substrate-binding protein
MYSFRRFRTWVAPAVLAAIVAMATSPAPAQTKLPIGTFPFPSFSNILADTILAEPVSFGTGGALWAGVAKGEIPVHNMSPYQLQKMRADGVPISLFGTLVRMATIQVITKNKELKSFADLKGRTFAATVAFAEFDYLQIYAKRLGFDLRKDVGIVDANTAMAQAQLEANRVDAIMAWEPSATMILNKNPDARVLVNGEEAWKFVTGNPGWDLFLIVRDEFTKQNPGAMARLLKMYQDVGTFVRDHPDEADAIVTSGKYASKGVPPGTIAAASKAGRLVIDVQPSWDKSVNEQIWKMLQLGFDDKHIPALPDRAAVVSEPPK